MLKQSTNVIGHRSLVILQWPLIDDPFAPFEHAVRLRGRAEILYFCRELNRSEFGSSSDLNPVSIRIRFVRWLYFMDTAASQFTLPQTPNLSMRSWQP
jgi:hypothetical protein